MLHESWCFHCLFNSMLSFTTKEILKPALPTHFDLKPTVSGGLCSQNTSNAERVSMS